MEVLQHFGRESYARRLDIAQQFSCLTFLRHSAPKYILENI